MKGSLALTIVVVVTCHAASVPNGHGSTGHSQKGAYPSNFPTPSEHYITYSQLDSKGEYFLFWKTTNDTIQFETHVKTTGYIGFGISHNGAMHPSDSVIGWVTPDGKTHFEDRHSVGNYEPIIDTSQDWTLLYGMESAGWTILKFSRKIDTCDDKEDIVIEHGTTKVIWSFHDTDPIHETGLTYHGTNRGAKSLLLLDTVLPVRKLPSDAKHYDFVTKRFHVPARRTYYYCTVHELPKLTSKNHMVMFEPIIEKANMDIVHHLLVYICPIDMSKYNGMGYECYETNNKDFRNCESMLLAWAVGGEPFYYPDNVGLPLGETGGPTHVVLESHYNNPNLFKDRVDSSGLRIHYTPTLRTHDAAVFRTGVMVEEFQIIPPNYEHFTSRGYCNQGCMNRSLSRTQTKEMNVFAVFQHAHLLGRGIKTRLIRNGVEQTPIITDDHYDFDFQDTRLLPQERVLKMGDEVITQCDYNSRKEKSLVYGGLGTNNEMCISFLHYYPRMPMANCWSVPIYSMYGNDPWSSRALTNYLSVMDWKNATVRESFQKNTDNAQYSMNCDDYAGPIGSSFTVHEKPSTIQTPYVPPSRKCT